MGTYLYITFRTLLHLDFTFRTFLHLDFIFRTLLQTASELRGELSQTAIEHTKFLADHARRGADILHSVRGTGSEIKHKYYHTQIKFFSRDSNLTTNIVN